MPFLSTATMALQQLSATRPARCWYLDENSFTAVSCPRLPARYRHLTDARDGFVHGLRRKNSQKDFKNDVVLLCAFGWLKIRGKLSRMVNAGPENEEPENDGPERTSEKIPGNYKSVYSRHVQPVAGWGRIPPGNSEPHTGVSFH